MAGALKYKNMRLRVISSIFLIVIACLTCKRIETSIKYIQPDDFIKRDILISEFASDIFYIVLDDVVEIEFIISLKISKDSCFFISTQPRGVLKFDSRGDILTKIGNIGYGPGEYVVSHRIAIDNKSKTIFVLDLKSIKKYTFDNKYIGEIVLDGYNCNFTGIECLEDALLLYEDFNMGNMCTEWILLDFDGKILMKKENYIEPFKTNIGFVNNVSVFNGNVYYWNHFNDTIFEISRYNYKPKYIFNLKDKKPPMRNQEFDEYSRFITLLNILETKNQLFIRYAYNQKPHFTVYDKLNDVFSVVSKVIDGAQNTSYGFINDIDSGLLFDPAHYHSENGNEYLIGWFFPYEIKAHVASSAFKNSTPKYPEKKRELERLANSLSENDNPVLMIVKLKE
jgi:hypothetical protein